MHVTLPTYLSRHVRHLPLPVALMAVFVTEGHYLIYCEFYSNVFLCLCICIVSLYLTLVTEKPCNLFCT